MGGAVKNGSGRRLSAMALEPFIGTARLTGRGRPRMTEHMTSRSDSRRWRWAPALLLLATVLAVGCDSNDTPTSPTPAELALSAAPDPVSARASSRVDADGEPYDWLASFRVTVTELEGVAGTIIATSAVVQEASGGIVVGSQGDSVSSVDAAGNRLEGFGSTVIDFDIDYRFPSDRREALIDVTVTVEGDDEDDDDVPDFTESETITVSVI